MGSVVRECIRQGCYYTQASWRKEMLCNAGEGEDEKSCEG